MNRPLPLALLALALAAGCNRPAPAPVPVGPTPAGTPKPAETKDYPLKGVVAEVDRAQGIVEIEHEDIPGLMPAMTMPFTVTDKALLEDLQPGDEVEGTLRVESIGGRIVGNDLTRLVVTRPAEPPAMVLDTTGGSPSLRPKAKVLEPGQPVPDFAMTTQEGTPLRLSDLRGKAVILTFVFTRCPLAEACPMLDKKFAELQQRIEPIAARAESIRLLSLSFDPENDTPAVLAEHAKLVGARPPVWTFAAASHDELAKVAEPLGLSYGPTGTTFIHSLVTALIAPDGTLARLEPGTAWDPAALAAEAARLARP